MISSDALSSKIIHGDNEVMPETSTRTERLAMMFHKIKRAVAPTRCHFGGTKKMATIKLSLRNLFKWGCTTSLFTHKSHVDN